MSLNLTPFQHGETALQHYNACLTTAKLIELADMLVPLSNDYLAGVASKCNASLNPAPKSTAQAGKFGPGRPDARRSPRPDSLLPTMNAIAGASWARVCMPGHTAGEVEPGA